MNCGLISIDGYYGRKTYKSIKIGTLGERGVGEWYERLEKGDEKGIGD